MNGWHLVNLLLNLATCLSPSLSKKKKNSEKVWSAHPDLGAHHPHLAAAFCYFGEKLVISLRSLLFLTPLQMSASKVSPSFKMYHHSHSFPSQDHSCDSVFPTFPKWSYTHWWFPTMTLVSLQITIVSPFEQRFVLVFTIIWGSKNV
jgi:hypothetical protein